MSKVLIFLLTVLVAFPASAQLYSYRNQAGKLVITDRPIKSADHKLVDTYIPKDVLERRKRMEEDEARFKGSTSSNSKTRLSKQQIEGLAVPIARSMNVDPDLVMAVIEIESGRDAKAKSSKGAMGLMQLMPATAERFGVKNAWDPRQNIRGGITYLRYLLSYFEGDVNYVLAAYNAGENAVDRNGGIPPYKETIRYIEKIRKIYTVESLPFTDAANRRSILVGKTEMASAETSGTSE